MPSKQAEEAFQNDRKHVLHSWSVQTKLNPMVVEKAEGVYFWDANGKRYLDMASQLVNANIGHQHPKVIQAIRDQAEKLCFVAPGIAHEARSTLAKLLSEVCPPKINRFFFTNGGADANENALKIARAVTGRSKVLARYRSYHGATYGAVTLTGDPRRWPVEPGIPGVVRIPDFYPYRAGVSPDDTAYADKVLADTEEIIQLEGPHTIAAMILETVIGSNGLLIPSKRYFQGLRALCDKYGILMIADEVMAGFGRTGKWFAVENFGVEPDLITMAKGINSGYVPLGAVGVSDAIGSFIEDKMLYCGLTYSGHPLACAAAVATIQAYRDEKIIENAAARGLYLTKLLAALKAKHPSIGDVRNIGLFGAIELVKDQKTREPLVPFNTAAPVNAEMAKVWTEGGLYVYQRWNFIFVVPPLIVTDAQLDEAFAVFDKALSVADQYAGAS
jgi:taurine--2-oxoglutarate transaminase